MLERTPAQYFEPAPSNARCRRALTTRFRTAWKLGVEGIVTAAQVIVEAKEKLPHGQFLEWVEHDLKLGERKAQCLMLIARHPVLANPHHWCAFPPSWRTLYELTYLCRPGQNPKRMLDLIASGKINPFMTREDAVALLPGRQQVNGKPILGADLARLHWLCSRLTVQEAIASLRADPGGKTPQSRARAGPRACSDRQRVAGSGLSACALGSISSAANGRSPAATARRNAAMSLSRSRASPATQPIGNQQRSP